MTKAIYTIVLLLLLSLTFSAASANELEEYTRLRRGLDKSDSKSKRKKRKGKGKKIKKGRMPTPAPVSAFPSMMPSESPDGGRDDTGGGVIVPPNPFAGSNSCPSSVSDSFQSQNNVVPCLTSADCVDFVDNGAQAGVCCIWPTCVCGAAVPPGTFNVECTRE